MYRSAQSMINYEINAFDGNLGHCKDFLFDDQFWTVRYLVVNTGNWLTGRKVLITPASIERADWANNMFDVNLTKEQIENAPLLDEDAPVSRQYEISWTAHYGLSPYWLGPLTWGATDKPGELLVNGKRTDATNDSDENRDKNLRSVDEIVGYRIHGSDNELGKVEDFILDDECWSVRYLVVNTGNWLVGRKVLISHLWIEFVSWMERSVTVNLTADQVENSPEYDPTAPVNRMYEERLYDYYGRPRYWE
jgi:uncharacterized protein YrrD